MDNTTATIGHPNRKLFRVLGTTDEVTRCDYCGRTELKGTVELELLDEDGGSEGTVFYGSGCAATAGKRTVKDIRDEAKAADEATRERRRAEKDARSGVFTAARDAWIAENVGPDAMDLPRKYGFSSVVRLVDHYIQTTGDKP